MALGMTSLLSLCCVLDTALVVYIHFHFYSSLLSMEIDAQELNLRKPYRYKMAEPGFKLDPFPNSKFMVCPLHFIYHLPFGWNNFLMTFQQLSTIWWLIKSSPMPPINSAEPCWLCKAGHRDETGPSRVGGRSGVWLSQLRICCFPYSRTEKGTVVYLKVGKSNHGCLWGRTIV